MADKLSALFERYAAGLARPDELPWAEPGGERRRFLVAELLRRGIRGWPERALGAMDGVDVEVELPVIVEHATALRRLVRELDDLGAAHLILHELFVSPENLDAMSARRYRQDESRGGDKLRWSGVASSDEAALELLLYGMESASRLSLYYCSTSTQQWIAENSVGRRA